MFLLLYFCWLELWSRSIHHSSCMFSCLSPPKRLYDFIIIYWISSLLPHPLPAPSHFFPFLSVSSRCFLFFSPLFLPVSSRFFPFLFTVSSNFFPFLPVFTRLYQFFSRFFRFGSSCFSPFLHVSPRFFPFILANSSIFQYCPISWHSIQLFLFFFFVMILGTSFQWSHISFNWT